MGDYGVGGSREAALGIGMKRFEARHPANMLVTLGDNDYLESPARFRANWQKAFGWARRSGLRVGGVLGNHDYELGRGGYQLKTLGMPGSLLHAPAWRRRPALLPRLERDHDAADEVARAAALRLGRDVEDRALPPRAVHLRWPHRRRGCRSQLGAVVRKLRRPARPLWARPQLPAFRRAQRGHVRRPRRRGGGALSAARLSALISATRPGPVRARLPLRVGDRRAPGRVRRRPPRPRARPLCPDSLTRARPL